MAFTILHVSDVHFGVRDDQGEQGRITSALVRAASSEDWKADLCVFSGDLGYSGRAEQFETGEKWLLELAEAHDCPLFIVPGNHDVDRNAVPMVLRCAHESPDQYRAQRGALQDGAHHLEAFRKWHERLKTERPGKVLSDWTSTLGCHTSLSAEDMDITLVGLNTALLARGERDQGHLVQDIQTLNSALQARNSADGCTIAIGHHPLAWLVPWNGEQVTEVMSQETGVNLYLHGHRHEQEGKASGTFFGQSMAVYDCGAAYQGSQFPQFFSFYRLDFETREVWPHVYAFSREAGEWVRNEARSRKMVAPIPQIRAATRTATVQECAARPDAPARRGGQERGKADEEPGPPRGPGKEAASTVSADEIVQKGRVADAQIVRTLIDALLRSLGLPPEDLFYPHHLVEMRDGDGVGADETVEAAPVECAEEACGLRLVTYFQSAVAKIVGSLLRLVREPAPGCPGLRTGRAARVSVLTARRDSDPFSIVPPVREAIEGSGVACAVEVRPSTTGYSSVRLLLEMNIAGPGEDERWLPLDIEVSNVLEEVWGRLDYRFRYGGGRGKVAAPGWQPHLNVLRAQFETCMQYLDLVRDLSTSKDQSSSEIAPHTPRSLARPDQILGTCRNLPEPLYNGLVAAFDLWKKADASRQFGGEPGSYRRAADAFGRLLEAADNEGKSPHEGFRYIVRMEQAYLLIMTGDETDAVRGEEIYRDILKERPEDASALFRLGHSLRSLKKLDEAIVHFSRAIELANAADGHEFYEGERDFIYDHARIALGNTYFRQFESATALDEKRRLIRQAIETAHGVFLDHRSPKTGRSALNDYLYYAWEQRRILEAGGSEELALTDEQFAKLGDLLEAKQKDHPSVSYENDDTLARVWKLVSQDDRSRAAFTRVLDWLERAAEKRSGEVFSAAEDRYSFQWAAKVAEYLRTRDERDAFFTALDACRRRDG